MAGGSWGAWLSVGAKCCCWLPDGSLPFPSFLSSFPLAGYTDHQGWGRGVLHIRGAEAGSVYKGKMVR